MASKENKIIRRASALNELARLSGLLAEQLDIEVPDVQITNKDSELAEIQRLENVNGLLTRVLESGYVANTADDSAKKPPVKLKHGVSK